MFPVAWTIVIDTFLCKQQHHLETQ